MWGAKGERVVSRLVFDVKMPSTPANKSLRSAGSLAPYGGEGTILHQDCLLTGAQAEESRRTAPINKGQRSVTRCQLGVVWFGCRRRRDGGRGEVVGGGVTS